MASKPMAGSPGRGRGRGEGRGRGQKPAGGSHPYKGKRNQEAGSSGSQAKSKVDESHYVLKKNAARKPSRKENDIYVNHTSDFAMQMARCRKLFEQGHKEISIHGLGVAINRAINLALQLKETSSFPMEVHVDTSTVEVVDDLEPLQDEYHHMTQSRLTSAVHISLRQAPLTEPRTKIVYSQQTSLPAPPVSTHKKQKQ